MTALIAVEHHPDGLTTGFHAISIAFHGKPAVRRERHGPATGFLANRSRTTVIALALLRQI